MLRMASWPPALTVCLVGAVLLEAGVLTNLLWPRGSAAPLPSLSLSLAAFGAVLLVSGVAALVITRRWTWLQQRYAAPATIVALTLLAWAGAALAVVPALLLDPNARRVTLPVFLLAGVLQYGTLLLSVYWLVVRPSIIPWRAMGLTRQDLRRVMTFRTLLLSFLGLAGLATATELLLRVIGIQQTQLQGLTFLREVPAWQYVLVVVMGAVVAPVAEEVFFRGYVFRAVHTRYGLLPAYAFSSVLFAVIHLNLQALVPILVIALYLGYLYQRTGSIVPGIFAHACNNAIAFLALYYFR